MTSFKLTNTARDNAAEKLQAVLGSCYMRFRVHACPAYGSFDIWVETDYTEDENEAKDMVLDILASAATR